jgi:hypothetical protein
MKESEIPAFTLTLVQKYLTKELLEEGIEEVCKGSRQKKFIGSYLTWVVQKVQQIEALKSELDEVGLTWKDVSRKISDTAKEYYLNDNKLY